MRQQGGSKRRSWRKLPLAGDEARGEIVAAIASEAGGCDAEAVPALLEQGPGPLAPVRADGAYDKRRCYEALEARGATAVIPPRRDAKIWPHKPRAAAPGPRDEHLRAIRRQGRRRWKAAAGAHRRSVAQTTFFRCKTIFGPTLRARTSLRHATELLLTVAALTRMTHLGMPHGSRRAA